MTAPAPGPYDWRRIGRAGSHGLYNIFLTDKDGRNIAGVWGRPNEKEATADLLAAAPDLLAACELANTVIRDPPQIPDSRANAFDAVLRQIGAAIGRARGENRG